MGDFVIPSARIFLLRTKTSFPKKRIAAWRDHKKAPLCKGRPRQSRVRDCAKREQPFCHPSVARSRATFPVGGGFWWTVPDVSTPNATASCVDRSIDAQGFLCAHPPTARARASPPCALASRPRTCSRARCARKCLAKVNILLNLRNLCNLHICRKIDPVFVCFAQVFAGWSRGEQGDAKRLLVAFWVNVIYFLCLSRKKLYEKC